MAIAIMFVAALAWSAWLAWDAVRECRKIDRVSARSRAVSLSTCLEAR